MPRETSLYLLHENGMYDFKPLSLLWDFFSFLKSIELLKKNVVKSNLISLLKIYFK